MGSGAEPLSLLSGTCAHIIRAVPSGLEPNRDTPGGMDLAAQERS